MLKASQKKNTIIYIYIYIKLLQLTESFRRYSTLGTGISNPIVILERMHRLKDGRDASYVRINLRIAEELCGQVRIKPGLYRRWRVYP